jgi:hypothetical protein
MPRPKKPADERDKERVVCPGTCGKTLARGTLRTHRCERKKRTPPTEEELRARQVTRAKRKFDEAVARYNELQPKVPRTYAEVVAGARSPDPQVAGG